MLQPPADPRYRKRQDGMKFFFEGFYLWCMQRLFWPHLRAGRHASIKGRPFKSILIIRHNMLGDAVVSSILIQALRTLYPDARISVLASEYNKGAFTWIPGLHEIHVWPHQFRQRRALIQRLKGQFDLVFQTLFDEHYNNRMLVGRLIADKNVLIGRARQSPIQYLMDHPVDLPLGSYACKLLSLLSPLTDTPLQELVRAYPRYVLNLPEHDKTTARESLARVGVHHPFVLLNITARESFRSMGDLQAANVAQALIANGHAVVIGCAPAELPRARSIQSKVPGAVVCEHASLGAAMAAVELASLYIGPDTGTVHVAAAAGIPCVVLFAAIARPDIWSPYGVPFISLQAGPSQAVTDIPDSTIVDCALELLRPGGRGIQRIQLAEPLYFAQPEIDAMQSPERTPAVKLVKKVATES